MPLPLLLDSNILSRIVRPDIDENQPFISAVYALLRDERFELFVPEIIDYEMRRKLLHLGRHRHQGRRWALEALVILDKMVAVGYLPLTTNAMRLAADIWAQTRADGQSRASEENLDVDVILAAQARHAGGYVVTMNERHFRKIADIFDWRPYLPSN
jgi:toxin FitB